MNDLSTLSLEERGIRCLLSGDSHASIVLLGRALREGSETSVRPFFVAMAQLGVIGYLPELIWEHLFLPVEESWYCHLKSYYQMVHDSDEIPNPRGRSAANPKFASQFIYGKEVVDALRYMESLYFHHHLHSDASEIPPRLASKDCEYWSEFLAGWQDEDEGSLSKLVYKIIEAGAWLYVSYLKFAIADWFEHEPDLCGALIGAVSEKFSSNQSVHVELAFTVGRITMLGGSFPNADELLASWRKRWPLSSQLAYATARLHEWRGEEVEASEWGRRAFRLDSYNIWAAWRMDTLNEKPTGFMGRRWHMYPALLNSMRLHWKIEHPRAKLPRLSGGGMAAN